MAIDTQKLRRLTNLPMALGRLEKPLHGDGVRFVRLRTVLDVGIEVWGRDQIDEYTERLWLEIDVGVDRLAKAQARIDAQTAALTVAREFIATTRAELVVAHGINGVIPADDTLGLAGVADCDAILGQIDAGLAQHQGGKHGDQ